MLCLEESNLGVSISSSVSDEQFDLASDIAKRRIWTVVRRAMKNGGLTQAEAARILGVNRSTVSRLLASPHNVSIDRASRIVRAAGSFLTFGYENVEASAAECRIPEGTRTNYLKVVNNQPGNRWTLTFERDAGNFQVSGLSSVRNQINQSHTKAPLSVAIKSSQELVDAS